MFHVEHTRMIQGAGLIVGTPVSGCVRVLQAVRGAAARLRRRRPNSTRTTKNTPVIVYYYIGHQG